MLDKYIDQLNSLISRLTPAQKRKLLRDIASGMRRRNAQRITNNVDPDGYKFVGRRGERWKARPLRQGELLRAGQKFNYFKGVDLELKNVIDRGNRFVGREVNGNPEYRASGFLKKWIYLKTNRTNAHMFQKMPRAKWLKFKADTGQAEIGFWGMVGSIAAEHQTGIRSKKLPMRQLIGFSDHDLNYVGEAIINHLAVR